MRELKVLLVGNYIPDEQQSMQRFSAMLATGLTRRGHTVRTISAQPIFGKISRLGVTARKWLAYIDKFIFFPPHLTRAAQWADIVHICDHSNALYIHTIHNLPHVITCHDLLTVRGALGEETFTPVSPTGKILQKIILGGLKQASMIVCDSQATIADARRLLLSTNATTVNHNRLKVIPLGLNYPFQVLPPHEVDSRLKTITGLNYSVPFLLHVGSDLVRKNRQAVIRIFRQIKDELNCQLVFAGFPLSHDQIKLAQNLNLSDSIIQITSADNKLLEALYNRAFALIFPSLSEGFGWPIIEAQACGCPVVSSTAGSLPEVAGQGALLRDPEDEAGFTADLIKLKNTATRQSLLELGQKNLQHFSVSKMIEEYEKVYYEIIA